MRHFSLLILLDKLMQADRTYRSVSMKDMLFHRITAFPFQTNLYSLSQNFLQIFFHMLFISEVLVLDICDFNLTICKNMDTMLYFPKIFMDLIFDTFLISFHFAFILKIYVFSIR